jgi:cysteine desulfurase family protein
MKTTAMPARLYADNAATSFPKPPQVFEATRAYALELGAPAGRSGYREALEAERIVADCRRRLAAMINAERPEHVIFALNCTAALNQAIKGLLRPGAHVVTTSLEHNSVLRPLFALRQERPIDLAVVRADPTTGRVDPGQVMAACRPDTQLVAITHASNVTGAIQPIEDVARETRRRGIICLVDAAQTAGHVPIDVQAMNIDLLTVPGHKGLLGPLGTGALYIRPGLEQRMTPLLDGGTGSESEQPRQPDFLPDKFEAGSLNVIGLAGLGAALSWIADRTVTALQEHDRLLSRTFLDALAGAPGLTLFGPRAAPRRVAVFSVRLDALAPAELSTLLEAEFGILTRSGLHCAPLAHETIGTEDSGETTRISFGPFTTEAEVRQCAAALRQLSGAGRPA